MIQNPVRQLMARQMRLLRERLRATHREWTIRERNEVVRLVMESEYGAYQG